MPIASLFVTGLLALHAVYAGGPGIERITPNGNTGAAGSLNSGVLTVQLEIRAGEWWPDGDADASLQLLAFGEAGKGLQIPGPLIRVKEGTEIRVDVRNTTDHALVVRGLYTRGAAGVDDTIHLSPGSTREVRFMAGIPGTYFYWASTPESAARPGMLRDGFESQLSGALVIDPRDAPESPADRVFVLGLWTDTAVSVIGPSQITRFVINGTVWPHTERLNYQLGDSIRWRIINTSAAVHPMHLHGFYYRVNSRGAEGVDTIYPSAAPPHMVVTERIPPGRTISMTWVPERAGNWLFHCHDNVHILPSRPFNGSASRPVGDHANHALSMMGGLVLGVHVSGPAGQPQPAPRRKLRLVAGEAEGGTSAEPYYGFVLDDAANGSIANTSLLPGPTLVLKRGEPVTITVVNELSEPTAVHWHGIELESYFDGVAGFAGAPDRIAPAIAPRDSFEARFTPPRAGTFIYHTHIDEVRQQRAGLSGALLVVDAPDSYDPETDIVLMISTPRLAADANLVLLNGSTTPPQRDLHVGTRYRFRVINIHTFRPSMIIRLRKEGQGDGDGLTWRAVAKDGADLPADLATVRPAAQQMGNGETYDYEFVPTVPGDLRLEVTTAVGALLVSMPLRVR